MNRFRWAFVFAGFLAGCVPRQPADPAVTAKIVRICTSSGFFKLVNGAITIAYPAAGLPASILNAGIDRVCMDPERFASDVSTVGWLIKNMPIRRQVAESPRRLSRGSST